MMLAPGDGHAALGAYEGAMLSAAHIEGLVAGNIAIDAAADGHEDRATESTARLNAAAGGDPGEDGNHADVLDDVGLLAHTFWMEEHLRAAEVAARRADVGYAAARRASPRPSFGGRHHLRVGVHRDVAELRLPVANKLTFAVVSKEEPRSVRLVVKHSVRSRPVRFRRAGVWRRVALVQGHGMGHPIAGG